MTTTAGTCTQWLQQARIPEGALTAAQRGLLEGAFAFSQERGGDYYSQRLLSHFLLHGRSGLKVAQIARLVGVSRPTASHQQGMSSKEVVQAAHHRMAGRPSGKLLPRYAGPIAAFLLTHADASRYDLLDFIAQTWGVRVSRIALYHFLKKYGLDRAPGPAGTPPSATDPPASVADAPTVVAATAAVAAVPPDQPVPLPAPPFSWHGPSTRGRSC
jgi:transposase